MVNTTALHSYFQYEPNLPANIIALVAYVLITAVLAYQTWRCIGSRLAWIVVLTGGIETGGYISRLVARQTAGGDDAGLNAYIANLVLIILAPNFLQLFNYLVAGKIAQVAGVSGRWINPRNISVFFFTIDIITIAVQGAGSSIIASDLEENDEASKPGENIVLAGLAVQLFFFVWFLALTGYVWSLTHGSRTTARIPAAIFACLWVTCVLICTRNIYRIVEIACGWKNVPNTSEPYFYCLDFLPIYLAFLCYSALFIPRYFQSVQILAGKGDAEASIGLPARKFDQPEQADVRATALHDVAL